MYIYIHTHTLIHIHVCACTVSQSCLILCASWTARHTPLSIRFSRQEYWSGLPFPTQGIFPIQGLNPHFLCLLPWQVDS